MKDNIDQEYKRLVIFNTFMIVFFGTLLAAGSFADEQIARFLYSPDNTFVKFVTSTGVYPFFAFAVLFTGALCGMMIMFTRMILGAHYLSDVASGAVISSCIALVYTVIQHKISGIKAGK